GRRKANRVVTALVRDQLIRNLRGSGGVRVCCAAAPSGAAPSPGDQFTSRAFVSCTRNAFGCNCVYSEPVADRARCSGAATRKTQRGWTTQRAGRNVDY